MKLGEVLADMVLYGDIFNASWPDNWPQDDSCNEEADIRRSIAATFLKLANRIT